MPHLACGRGYDFQTHDTAGRAADAGGRLWHGVGAAGRRADAAGGRKIAEAPAAEADAAPTPTTPTSSDLRARLEPAQCRCLDADRPVRPRRRASPQAAGGAAMTSWSSKDKANGSAAVSVKQPLSPFWDARVGADMTVTASRTLTMSELLAEKARQWRQRAAILRHRMGGDHRPRRRLDLGQDRGRGAASIPRRSRASSAPR